MNGLFNIKLLNSSGLKDEDFLNARKCGELDNLINDLNTDKEFFCKNRIFDNMATSLLCRLFSIPNAEFPYNSVDSRCVPLGFICMLETDNEPGYTENWFSNLVTLHGVYQSVNTSSGAKKFISDQLYRYEIWVDENREEVIFKNAWMYLPTQCVSDNIKSIGIYWNGRNDSDGVDADAYRARIGRVKIKDGSGLPVTLQKTIDQVMFVQYIFSTVSI